jgi:hypothetical protein
VFPFCTDSEGGMFGFFLLLAAGDYATVMTTDNARFNALFSWPAGPRRLSRATLQRSGL